MVASAVSASMIVCLLLAIGLLILSHKSAREGMSAQAGEPTIRRGNEIYTPLYCAMHDSLFRDQAKDSYECTLIQQGLSIDENAQVLQIGLNNGHKSGLFSSGGATVTGTDAAETMVGRARSLYPNVRFELVDVDEEGSLSRLPQQTHILLLDFEIYKHKDKARLFNRLHNSLVAGGKLALHTVDRDKFDPVLPGASVFLGVSPRKYVDNRITKSHVEFDTHSYTGSFNTLNKEGEYEFVEFISPKDGGSIVHNVTPLYMPKQKELVEIAKRAGFAVAGSAGLEEVGYEHHRIYFLEKAA